MTSARNLFRTTLALGALAIAAVTIAMSSVLNVVHFQVPPLDALLAACQGLLTPEHGEIGILALVLGGVATAVVILAARSLLAQLRSQRSFLKRLPVGVPANIGEIAFQRFEASRPEAFCAGLMRPAIYISGAAVRELSGEELYAVACHEDYHRRRRDPLRIVITRVLADAFIFLPALRQLAERYRALAELAADEAAVHRSGRRPLASALLRFGDSGNSGAVVGIAPERVDHLLGARPRWELPITLLVLSLLLPAAVLVFAANLLELSPTGGLEIALVIGQSCMFLMVAIPATLLPSGVVSKLRVSRRSCSEA